VCKNAATPMIMMLDHSELDIEVSDVGMETAESDDCRGVSKILMVCWSQHEKE